MGLGPSCSSRALAASRFGARSATRARKRLGDGVDALAQALKLGVRQVAPIERGLLLIEVELEGVELRP